MKRLKSLLSLAKRAPRSGGEFACSVCGVGVRSFEPLPAFYEDKMRKHGFPYDLRDFETLNVEQYSCPACHASDRERLYALYLDGLLAGSGTPRRMLDFSPSPAMDARLRNNPALHYSTADLLTEDVDFRTVDITDLVFRDGLFDLVICSHVLEHVSHVDRALRELHRVMTPGGRSILMVPIVAGLDETREDSSHTTEAERWRHYGQDDHVRLFAREDFMRRVRTAGFDLDVLGIEHFGDEVFRRHGISSSSTLYVGTKR